MDELALANKCDCIYVVGVADQADIRLDDQSEAAGLRGGTETGW